MDYEVRLTSQRDIVLMRVENGWLIRTSDQGSFSSNPLRVAETPEALVEIVREWALSATGARITPAGMV